MAALERSNRQPGHKRRAVSRNYPVPPILSSYARTEIRCAPAKLGYEDLQWLLAFNTRCRNVGTPRPYESAQFGAEK